MKRVKIMARASHVALAFALTLLAIHSGATHAVGLGSVRVQSGLGQPLKVSVPFIGAENANILPSCISSRVESVDGAFLATPVMTVLGAGKDQSLLLSTRSVINEPALSVAIEIGCGAQIHRDFQILLDPVDGMTALAESVQRPGPAVRNNERVAMKALPPAVRGGDLDSVATGRSRENVTNVAQSRAPERAVDRVSIPTLAAPLAVRRNVLKLSPESLPKADSALSGNLKLSDKLGDKLSDKLSDNLTSEGLAIDPARQREIRLAQNQFAMILRGEDPLRNAEMANAAQASSLKLQTAAARAQRMADQAAFDDLRQNSLPLSWGIVLGALLLVSLAVAAWIGTRLLALRRQGQERPWDMSVLQTHRGQPHAGDFDAEGQDIPDEEASELFSGSKKQPANLTSVPEFLRSNEIPQAAQVAPRERDPLAFESMPKRTGVEQATTNTMDMRSADTAEALQFHFSKVENLKVEEVSDIMQEAEFWISLNDSARAIDILEPYAELDFPESPLPWLYLLDLYIAAGEREKYELLRQRSLKRFNAHIAPWKDLSADGSAMTLEDFPHVIERICALWETDEILPYLEQLMLNTRDEERQGFDISVYREIVLLMSIARGFSAAKYIHPIDSAQSTFQ